MFLAALLFLLVQAHIRIANSPLRASLVSMVSVLRCNRLPLNAVLLSSSLAKLAMVISVLLVILLMVLCHVILIPTARPQLRPLKLTDSRAPIKLI